MVCDSREPPSLTGPCKLPLRMRHGSSLGTAFLHVQGKRHGPWNARLAGAECGERVGSKILLII